MKNKSLLLTFLLILSMLSTAWADDIASLQQNGNEYYVNMASSGTTILTLDDANITTFKVYDDGGKNNNYAYANNSTLKITVPGGCMLKITGTAVSPDTYYDYWNIYNGHVYADGTLFGGQNKSYSSSIDVATTGNKAAIWFHRGKSAPTGTRYLELTVTIIDVAKDIAHASVTGLAESYTYTGSAISLEYTVTAYGGSTPLTKGTDYTETITKGGETVTSAIEEGNYTLTITGINPYKGSQSFDFDVWNEVGTLSIDNSFSEGEAGYYYINMPGVGMHTKTLDLSNKSDGFAFNIYDDGGKGEWGTGPYWDETSTLATKGSFGYIKITAPAGFVIQLTGKVMTTNDKAYLTVYNGDNTNCQTLLANVHGANGGRADAIVDIGTLVSTGNTMLVYFQNNSSWESEGLWLTATLVNNNTIQNITYADYSNGTVTSYVNSVAVTAAVPNTEVTLSVAPDDGYIINYITVTDGNNNIIPVTGGRWYSSSTSATFTMPASAVTVTPVFIATNNMTASNGLRYDASSNVNSISMGSNVHSYNIYADTRIDLTVSADEGNKLKFDGSVGAPTVVGLGIYDGSNSSATTLFGQKAAKENVSAKSSGTSMYFISNGSTSLWFWGTIAQIYAISYDLTDGTLAGANPIEYTCESDAFTLNNPTREGYEFAGWMGTGLDAASTNVTIAKGNYGNREYTATWKKLLTNTDITIAAIPDQTYTGSAIEPEVTVTDGETPLTLGTDYTVSYSANINVGTATATITGIGDYSGTVEKEFAITKATLTVTAKNKTIAYGDEPANDGVEYAGFASEEGASILSGILAYEYNYVQGDPPSEYSITPSGLTADNYEIEFVAGKLTVERKEISIAWGNQTSFVYNGTEQAPTATAEGLVNGDECTITVSGAKDVGSHTATATELSNANYKLPTTGLEQNFEITKATLTVTAKNKTIAYGDEPANDGVEYSSFLGSDDASVLGGTLTYGYNYEKGNKTGEYVITPSGLTADNYEINFVSGTLTVETKKTTFAAIQVFEDENGKRAEIAGEYDGPDAVNITEDIKHVAVTFDREFTPNSGHATIMFPFDVKASSLTGVKSVIEFTGITKIDGNNAVGMGYVWCNATLGQKEVDENHPNCNKYSGELKAYTPYMIEMDSPTLGIKDAVTFKSNSGKIVGDAPVGNWVFRGTLQKKVWPKGTGIINEGRLWAFAAAERSGAKIGEFVQFGGNNWANPFRAYLVECKKSGDSWDCQDDSEPKASLVSRYRFADALAPTNSAEKLAGAVATDEPLVLRQAAASETASLSSMDIVIVYGDKDSDQERPTVIGRFNPATGEIRMLPRTKQTYDLKGRKVGNGKKAKGAYYRR